MPLMFWVMRHGGLGVLCLQVNNKYPREQNYSVGSLSLLDLKIQYDTVHVQCSSCNYAPCSHCCVFVRTQGNHSLNEDASVPP